MSNRSKAEKNREKVIQDRLQLLLTRMLQDEDNKYCVECDSKSPRWASWNIGVFLCIRCAGIHRNLGVHISKVKSVNLDSWTPQQVASMQMMGNSKGRAVYEAGVPEDFRRPQNDSALESFIRSKYEKKKYVAREWTPSKPPDLPLGWEAIIEAEKQKKDLRSIVLPSRSNVKTEPASPKPVIDKTSVPAKKEKDEVSSTTTSSSGSADLLGLSLQTSAVNGGTSQVSSVTTNLDLLSLGDSGNVGANDGFTSFVSAPTPSVKDPAPSGNSDVDFEAAFSTSSTSTTSSSQMSKDSIMALFNKPASGGAVPPAVGGSNSNGLAGLNFGVQGQQGFPAQFQQAPLQQPFGVTQQSQLNQFGGMQGTAAPPQNNVANNPFLANAVDLGFGAIATNGNAKNSSWGFGQ